MQGSFIGSVKPISARQVSVARPQRVATVVENRVALRFQRFGRKKLPFYRLVAIDSKDRRDGRPLEYLGWYDPIRKESKLKSPEIKKWISTGAQPSDTVRSLLRKAEIIQPDAAKEWSPKVQAAAPEQQEASSV